VRMPQTRTVGATIVSLLAAVLLAILLTGCGGGGERATARPSAPAERSLKNLASVEDFAALFDEKEGAPRLVLLLSPT
jgi:hypothetical protein